MKGQEFSLPHRVAKQYERAIKDHVTRVLPPKLPEQTFTEWITSISKASQEATAREATDHLAGQMVRWVTTLNQRSWRAAAAKAQQSRLLSSLLMREMQGPVGQRVHALVRDNASYISSLPQEAAEQLTKEILRAQQNGARPTTIAKMARQRFPQLLRSRINLIARTETAKASAALTQARCRELNLPCYVWSTSEDARVRISHKRMDGVVVFWDSPPNPELLAGESSSLGHYHAGECPNCRCTQIVLLSPDDIGWPHRIYYKGSLRVVTKTQFKGLINA